MKSFIFILVCFLIFQETHSQGCVAIRSNGGTCSMQSHNINKSTDNWLLSMNNRYFRSYKHFVGKEEQKERVEKNTEVVNYSYSAEFGITRQFNNRWSLGLNVPIISNARSSLYEHYGNTSTSPNARRYTRSFGLGDVRLAAYYWLLNPTKSINTNVQLGLGLKLPTGDYRYADYFYRNDSTNVLGPVDQSIQLGDGGTGFTTELNAFHNLTKSAAVYANAFYLFNPREQNGVSTARGGTPSAASIKYGSNVMSVPDQYMFRAGGNYTLKQFTFSAGMRIEGVPAEDLIGGSNGFRRPGYVLSVEPVVAYRTSKMNVYLSVPYAIERNRTQSVPDKIRSKITGVDFKGDAAFADYSINVGVGFQLK